MKKLCALLLVSSWLVLFGCDGGDVSEPDGGDGDTGDGDTGDGDTGDGDGDTGDGDGDTGDGDTGDGDGDNPIDEPSGLDERPANPTCKALPRPVPKGGELTHEPLAPGVDFPNDEITDIRRGPVGVPVWFGIAKNTGEVFAVPDGASERQTVFGDEHLGELESGGGETGLLGMAVDPAYPNAENPDVVRLFLYYTSNECLNGAGLCSHLRRFDLHKKGSGANLTFEVDPDTNCDASPDCEQILTVNQPAGNHNGGALAFGNDGYLYLTFGDGGGAGGCHSINLGTPMGKMLRLDVHAEGVPYAIPPDNPYASETELCNEFASSTEDDQADNARGKPCPEIVAAGLRNPFRIGVDRQTGDIWIGDVGQNTWEMTYVYRADGLEADKVQNFGWPRREGPDDYHNQDGFCNDVNDALRDEGPFEPLKAFYPNPAGQAGSAVAGGLVYRGTALGEKYIGHYFMADVYNGNVWAVHDPYDRNDIDLRSSDDLTHSGFFEAPYGFAEDENGELVIFSGNRAPARLVLANGEPGEFPTNLVDTGCVDPQDPSKPAAGLIPYDVNVALWSDGADKERYLALPDGQKIKRIGNCGDLDQAECEKVGDFDLPIGSVLVKIFRRNDVLLETRLLMRHDDGDWAGYTYVWNAEQTGATLAGDEVEIEGQDWLVPSHKQCLDCHTRAAGRSLGLEIAQLNRDLTYPATGRTANQLATWSAIGLFEETLSTPTAELPALKAGPDGDATELARSYMHANCAHCHRAGTPVESAIDLRYTLSFADMQVCNAEPTKGEWPEGARVLVPGSLDLSLISLRPKSEDLEIRMPQIGSKVVDPAGTALIDAWVQSISECPAP